ncbi:hypothetical protein BV22DRAFT_1190699 [Leucogyrophana mollusca]|uniref:Uncharacterized protein n=1 Tax=Leucogyrophana mollusca TaxID=85980 RepID=A0ACB8BZE5_9AGAM|nr:hypothetical protein BV22DRAFT_1190699 [Leucogyrophana mollusca]
MKPRHLICFLVLTSVALATPLLKTRIPNQTTLQGAGAHNRDLIGLLGGSRASGPPGTGYASGANSSPLTTDFPGIKGLGGLSTSSVGGASTSTNKGTESSLLSAANPSIATSVAFPKPTPTASLTSIDTSFAVVPTSGSLFYRENKTWKIVGVAIIATMVVAVVVSSVMFFDRLWRFAQEAFCCKGRPDGVEDFVQDWEKGIWEIPPSLDNNANKTSPILLPSETLAGFVKEKEVGTVRYSIVARPKSLPPAGCLLSSDPRELPWDVDSLRKCTLHRQLSQRSTRTPCA